MQLTQNVTQVVFTLKTAKLNVSVLTHLKQINTFNNTYNEYTISRVKQSNMFKLKNYIISSKCLQRLITTQQITVVNITKL